MQQKVYWTEIYAFENQQETNWESENFKKSS